MPETAKIWALIPAAGSGSRMQSEIPKQYLEIRGRCILEHTLSIFCQHPQVHAVVVALAAGDPWWPQLNGIDNEKLLLVEGGDERCHSVLNGLEKLMQLTSINDWVMVHDAARPCLRRADMDSLISAVTSSGRGGLLALPVRDTMKRGNDNAEVLETVDRHNLWQALTPQMFRLGELHAAIKTCIDNGTLVTDEAMAMERQQQQPLLIEGHADNIKVTRPLDLSMADLFLSRQESA